MRTTCGVGEKSTLAWSERHAVNSSNKMIHKAGQYFLGIVTLPQVGHRMVQIRIVIPPTIRQ